MRKKILIGFLILILTSIATTGIFVAQQARSMYKESIKEQILTVASLLDYELMKLAGSGSIADYDSISKDYANVLSSTKGLKLPQTPRNAQTLVDVSFSEFSPRITLIDRRGNVIGESQADYNRMENHLDRKEVQQALKNELGEEIRFSATLRMDFLYIAIPSSQSDIIIRVSVPLDQLRRIDRHILMFSLAGMAAGLLLSAILAWSLTSGIIKPVKNLTTAEKEIADGNYSKRVEVSSRDELGQLAATFNDMAAKLDKTVADLKDKNLKFDVILNSMTNSFVAVDSNERIIHINSIALKFFNVSKEEAMGCKLIEVIRNHHISEIVQKTIAENISSVTEVTLSTPETGTYRIYASPITAGGSDEKNSGCIISIHDITAVRKLETIRTEFVSNVTHELKTPLTSIKGFVETLRSGAVNDPETIGRFLEIIDIEAERLTMLINDILQLSEIENNVSDTNLSLCDMTDIIQEVISILRVSAEKKGITVSMEASPGIKIHANRDRIKQMLINLADNAIKYNKENGTIKIRASKNDGILIVSVEDTGIGIDPIHYSRVFERFYRVDKGRSRNMGGTGLGLSIVKHIVNLYNGDISITSKPGKGTIFTVHLPV